MQSSSRFISDNFFMISAVVVKLVWIKEGNYCRDGLNEVCPGSRAHLSGSGERKENIIKLYALIFLFVLPLLIFYSFYLLMETSNKNWVAKLFDFWQIGGEFKCKKIYLEIYWEFVVPTFFFSKPELFQKISKRNMKLLNESTTTSLKTALKGFEPSNSIFKFFVSYFNISNYTSYQRRWQIFHLNYQKLLNYIYFLPKKKVKLATCFPITLATDNDPVSLSSVWQAIPGEIDI